MSEVRENTSMGNVSNMIQSYSKPLGSDREPQLFPSPVRERVSLVRRSSGSLSVDPPTSRRVTRHSIAAWPFACRKQEGSLSVLVQKDNNNI